MSRVSAGPRGDVFVDNHPDFLSPLDIEKSVESPETNVKMLLAPSQVNGRVFPNPTNIEALRIQFETFETFE